MRAASALPRVEAKSEALRAGRRRCAPANWSSWSTATTPTSPCWARKLEVESGGAQGRGRFRAEQGDYAVTDAALLKALAAPGEHGLVFTLVAGAESDLLDGTLAGAAGPAPLPQPKDDHGHAARRRRPWARPRTRARRLDRRRCRGPGPDRRHRLVAPAPPDAGKLQGGL
jgi:hypothetical protein